MNFTCPRCGYTGRTREDKKFISEIGLCPGCDKAELDRMEIEAELQDEQD